MRFKVGELAGVAYLRNGNRNPGIVSIEAIGPYPPGSTLPDGINRTSLGGDYFCYTSCGNKCCFLDCQLIKLSDPDRAEELMEELENAIP